MKVGLVGFDYFPAVGGQGVYLYELSRHLPAMGFELLVICAKGTGQDVVAIGGDSPLAFSSRLTLRLDRIIHHQRLDILHVQGGPGGVFLLRRPRVPLLYTAHHLYIQQRIFMGKSPWRWTGYRMMQLLESRGYDWASHVIAVSSSTRDALVQSYGLPIDRVQVIPNGVDTERFRPNGVQKIPGSILYVGRLHPRKNLGDLIRALALVRQQVTHARLYIVGTGPQEKDLRDLAQSERLQEAVEFLGRVDEKELPGWYDRTEVFVLPSLFEGFGVVCLEAMSCGVPVVATGTAGTADVVIDEETGLLVPPKDVNALARALERLLVDNRKRHHLGQRARQRAEKLFAWPTVAEEVASCYRSLAGSCYGTI